MRCIFIKKPRNVDGSDGEAVAAWADNELQALGKDGSKDICSCAPHYRFATRPRSHSEHPEYKFLVDGILVTYLVLSP